MNEGNYPQPTGQYAGMSSGVDQYAARPGQENNGSSMPPLPPLAKPLPRQICINPLNHGFHVIVGCQAFAVESVDALLHRLNIYLKDPGEQERKWMAGEWKW
jgi:hypothetical protein